MSDLAERLARLTGISGLVRGTAALNERPPDTAPPANRRARGVEVLVDGQVVETPHGACFVREVAYAGETVRSRYALRDCLAQRVDELARLYPDAHLDQFDFANAVFLDTETSGLAGGAGTYAFMVGVGTFENRPRVVAQPADDLSPHAPAAATEPHFVVRQFFMRHEGEERALLHALAEVLDRHSGMVTFNGRAFDLPLLSNRFVMQRQPPRLTDAPHLDLLHPARRLWRSRLASCALGSLEVEILGLQRDQADVPGWLIPNLYFQYLQTGDASELVGVFYHNHEDILSMVSLATHLARLFADPWQEEALHALDVAALAWSYDQAGRLADAERAYQHALSHTLPDDAARLTYSRYGQFLKRQERYAEAAAVWQAWITGVSGADVEPYVELAKYYEWHAPDLEAALMWTRWAEHEVRGWRASPARRTVLAELQHRATRLQRKLGA